MEDEEVSYIYPTLEVIGDRGILGRVVLPQDYKELVLKFYEQKREESIELYSREVKSMLEKIASQGFPWDINLQWSMEDGLTNISIGEAGYDLDNGMFCEHNLGEWISIAAFAVATKYISELLKSK